MVRPVQEVIDYKSPYTQALFDRTPEQRARRGVLVVNLAEEMGPGRSDLGIHADIAMHYEFLHDVHDLVEDRAAFVQKVERCDEESARNTAVEIVREEIAELHQALPMPMIERLGGTE